MLFPYTLITAIYTISKPHKVLSFQVPSTRNQGNIGLCGYNIGCFYIFATYLYSILYPRPKSYQFYNKFAAEFFNAFPALINKVKTIPIPAK